MSSDAPATAWAHPETTHPEETRREIDPEYRIDPAQVRVAPAEMPYESYPPDPAVAPDLDDPSAPPAQQPEHSAPPGVRPLVPPTPRSGQLTFTSYDTPGVPGAGGWQVKQTQGDLSEHEIVLLTEQIATQFDAGMELPEFASTEQIAALPRRMVHAPLGPDASAIWHTSPAGTDASGRPGNVFAQVLLDRSRRAVGAPRPIERWRSAGWITPYGADQVRAAVLDAAPPQASGLVDAAAVSRFLTDPETFRLPVLAVLLDACRAAMAGGRAVVLICHDLERPALWIGAVSWVLSPDRVGDFFFATGERAAGLSTLLGRGVHLACVPARDAEALLGESGVVLLDEQQLPRLGDIDGEPHQTARGDRVAASAWSTLAQVMLAQPDGLARVAARAQQIAAQTTTGGADPTGDPAWATALAMILLGDEFADGHDDAAALVARSAPPSVLSRPALHETTARIVYDGLGEGAAAAWEALGHAAPGGLAAVLLAERYLIGAVSELEWLTRPGGVPLPSGQILSQVDLTGVAQAAATMAQDLADMASVEPVTVAAAAVRLAEVVGGLDLRGGAVVDGLATVLEMTVLPVLLGPRSALLRSTLGPLRAGTRRLLREMVGRAEGFRAAPVGQRVDHGVLRWLFPHGSAPELPTASPLTDADRLRGEVAVHLADRIPTLRPLAVWATLAEGGSSTDVAGWFTEPWPPAALSPVLAEFGRAIPGELWLPTLKAHPDHPDLTALCQRVIGTTERPGPWVGEAVLAVARMRVLQSDWWRQEHPYPAMTVTVVGASAAMTAPDTPFADDLWGRIRLAMIMVVLDPSAATVSGIGAHLERLESVLIAGAGELPPDAWDAVAVHATRLPTVQLVAGLASTEPALDLTIPAGTERWPWLGTMTYHQVPLLRSLVTHRLSGQGAPGPGEILEQLRTLPMRGTVGDRRARDRQLTTWVRDLVPARGRGLGRLFGGSG